MRLFVAIELPKDVKEELFSLQKKIGNENAKVKWVSKKNLHLTLKYLGESKVDLNEIISKLNSIKFNPFEIELGSLDIKTKNKYIGYTALLWASILQEREVIKLQHKIDSELLGLFSGGQEFSPHITLGRIKLFKKRDEFIKRFNHIKLKCIKFNISNFKLMESRLTKDGPIYKTVCKFNNNI